MRPFAPFLAAAAFGFCVALFSPASARAPSSPVENCLTAARDDETAQNACIGQFASNCIETTPGGETTAGIVQCVQAERFQWENVRGAQVTALRAIESPTQIALLERGLEGHRRWAEAHCAYRASVFEGGSLSNVVAAQCMRDLVAEHTLYLRNRYSED